MLKRTSVVLLWASAGCASSGLSSDTQSHALGKFPPGVIGSANVTYYDVKGRTIPEIRSQLREQALDVGDGRFAGESQWRLRWDYRTRANSSLCQLFQFHVYVSAEITLPRWTPPADTLPGVYAQWQQYIAGLETHEIGHKDIAAKEGQEIVRAFQTLTTPCNAVGDNVKRATDPILARLREEEAQYDLDTRHGALQGATLAPRRP